MGPRLIETARHEASHAVLALQLGREVLAVSINGDGSGECMLAPPRGPRSRAGLLKACRENLWVVLAGAAAEENPEPVDSWWRL